MYCKEYELDKVQPITRPITEMDALMLNYWLSTFVQEVAECSKDPYPSKPFTRLCVAFADSWWKRTQPSSSISWTLWTKGAWMGIIGEGGRLIFWNLRKLHWTFLFSSLDLLSLDEYWMQKWRIGLELALVWKWNKKKKSQSAVIWNVFPGYCLLKINDLC